MAGGRGIQRHAEMSELSAGAGAGVVESARAGDGPATGIAMKHLKASGVEFQFEEPYESSVCHMAFFADPDGNNLMLHHRYAPHE